MTDVPRPIIITGFMAAGKTTVAAALARELGCSMLDLDQFIVEGEGRTIRELIEQHGEAGFREIETDALRNALTQNITCVIALGGGAWTIEQNRALIVRAHGVTVWLDTPFDLCWRRITDCGEGVRPLARDEGQARRLYDERRSLYELAVLHVKADGGTTAEEIAADIRAALLQGSMEPSRR